MTGPTPEQEAALRRAGFRPSANSPGVWTVRWQGKRVCLDWRKPAEKPFPAAYAFPDGVVGGDRVPPEQVAHFEPVLAFHRTLRPPATDSPGGPGNAPQRPGKGPSAPPPGASPGPPNGPGAPGGTPTPNTDRAGAVGTSAPAQPAPGPSSPPGTGRGSSSALSTENRPGGDPSPAADSVRFAPAELLPPEEVERLLRAGRRVISVPDDFGGWHRLLVSEEAEREAEDRALSKNLRLFAKVWPAAMERGVAPEGALQIWKKMATGPWSELQREADRLGTLALLKMGRLRTRQEKK